jgi:hypothetical protein
VVGPSERFEGVGYVAKQKFLVSGWELNAVRQARSK